VLCQLLHFGEDFFVEPERSSVLIDEDKHAPARYIVPPEERSREHVLIDNGWAGWALARESVASLGLQVDFSYPIQKRSRRGIQCRSPVRREGKLLLGFAYAILRGLGRDITSA
jgi:hypothetical protein